MTLKQIFTCLLAYTVLATIADAQQIHNNNDAQVDTRLWRTYNGFHQQTLLQPYMPLPNFKLLQPFPAWPSQTPPVLYYHPSQIPADYPQQPLLPPFAQIPTHLTPQSTTRRPVVKDKEPTTKRPAIKTQNNPAKNINPDDFQNDAHLLSAVRHIDADYVIEQIVPVPGKLIYRQISGPEKLQKSRKSSKKTTQNVKVEATGKTASSGNVPYIPFDTYFLPYLSANIVNGGKTPAALILEPHAKAVVGNGGTAISTPISRAILKRGMPTNVYFNPESVAIAGVGGKAHAQTDLELDLMSR